MNTEYFKDYSPALSCDMECKLYGHSGKPILFIPCQDGRFFDFENFRMAEVMAPWIESGEIMVLSIDTIDQETWSDFWGDAGWRSYRHEQWIHYIIDEIVPFFQQIAMEKNGWDEAPGIKTFGCSLGAMHASNLYFRRPDLFDGVLALSGLYSAEYGFGSYMDDRVYINSPVHYMANLPAFHPYMDLYKNGKIILCVGQGPWERPEWTRDIHYILKNKGIDAWVDYWGYDSAHDWEWWYKQVVYFLPYLLED